MKDEGRRMKALTICQPYAHLIAAGEKWVENRTWSTLHRGFLALHAGKSRKYFASKDEHYPDIAWGAIVAVAILAECLPISQITAPPNKFRNRGVDALLRAIRRHAHTEGPWCWVLGGVIRFPTPIPIGGHQGLWNLPEDIERRVNQAIADDLMRSIRRTARLCTKGT